MSLFSVAQHPSPCHSFMTSRRLYESQIAHPFRSLNLPSSKVCVKLPGKKYRGPWKLLWENVTQDGRQIHLLTLSP